MKGFVIGATGSGTGKTTITLALLAFLSQKGYQVTPFKVGPDFIDPGHHMQVIGKTSYNIDSWMLPKEYNLRLFHEKAAGSDIAVVEGVMGIFDGYSGVSEAGSTAQMAKLLGLPAVLIVSAKGKARSAAAIVKGFETFDPDLNLAGVIFSKTGSRHHFDYLKSAVEATCHTPVLGHIPRNDDIIMPERHLGLLTAQEMKIDPKVLEALKNMVADHLDIEGFIRDLPEIESAGLKKEAVGTAAASNGPKIAIAKDKAFCFYYPDNLEMLEENGACLIEFSPLKTPHLPKDIDGIYFGGGYPEVHAQMLSRNESLLAEIKACSRNNMPIYGECGGFMYLCSEVASVKDGHRFKMTGCFDFEISMSERLRSLGYREIVLNQNTLLGPKGAVIRGHEFHYSSIQNMEIAGKSVYEATSRAGQNITLKGFQNKKTLGSYLHVHFGSYPLAAASFVDQCRAYRKTKRT